MPMSLHHDPIEACRPQASTTCGLCLFLVIGCAGVLDLFVAGAMSPTFDESSSVTYGERVLLRHPDRSDPLFNSKAPVAALNAAPRVLATYLNDEHVPPAILKILRSMRLARLASVMATLVLNFFIYRWAHALYGRVAAIAVSTLVVFSPNLIAHGTLSNNDGYFALGVVVALFFFRRYLLLPTWGNAWLSGVTLALAQLTKPFSLYLYAVVLVFLLVVSGDGEHGLPRVSRRNLVGFIAIALACFILVTNAGFCFDRSLSPLKSYHFFSEPFVRLQEVRVLRSLPVPLPYPFLQGLDMLKYHDESGLTYGKIYLLGELRDPSTPSFRSFKSYYAIAMFFKEPIAIQILFIVGLVWISRNRSYRELITGEGILLSAAILLFVWFSLFRKSQLGIRNILPVVAIEVIIAGAAFARFYEKARKTQIVLSFLVLWVCVSTLSYYPNLIPYMNEWVLDRKQSYRILVDSNLDWGQDAELVRDFLMHNPDVVLDPERPQPGRVLVSANRLVGAYHGYQPMNWLLCYKPVASVGYGHLLFLVPAHN
jgi:Dolichyl-phosphate-mannose-protein mannosyltransferase